MILSMLWETPEEREVVERLNADWLLYGAVHITNAKGITRLDPLGITYEPTGDEVQPTDTVEGYAP